MESHWKNGEMGENDGDMGERGEGKMGFHQRTWGKWVKARELVEIWDVCQWGANGQQWVGLWGICYMEFADFGGS